MLLFCWVPMKESIPSKILLLMNILKGCDVINKIKSEVEQVCPGVVSCSDIFVLTTREGVKLVIITITNIVSCIHTSHW